MIDFTTKQLSWIVISAITIGGGGYIALSTKVDNIDKQLAVAVNSSDNAYKAMDKIEKQLIRIEDKLDSYRKNK